MFFIYPAAVSENCERKVVVAACKCMERFFLTQICDSFESGTIRAKRYFKGDSYGPIVLESKIETKPSSLLMEDSNFKNLDASAERERELREKAERLRAERERIEREKAERERKLRERKSEKNAAYRPLDSKIDIIPTSAQIEVDVSYIYGPKSGQLGEDKKIVVGVKMTPFIMKNFKDVEQALLDDYFSRVSESAFKMIRRKIGSSLLNVWHRVISSIPFVKYILNSRVSSEQDDVKDTIYGPNNFVNASAFRSNRNTPGNYKFASNTVIFNKDDLTDPEDYNIFENRSAMNRLFNMGWSSFAVLDPIKEEMTFISALDGGYMHVIPYSYMFECTGTKTVYDSSDKLKGSSKPFSIRRGNFSTFAKYFEK